MRSSSAMRYAVSVPPPELPVQPILSRDDVLAALQVVDHAHAVPDAELRDVRAEQRAAEADHRVLGRAHAAARSGCGTVTCGASSKTRALLRRVEHLIALALPDGVVANRRHAVPRQQDADAADTVPPPCRRGCARTARAPPATAAACPAGKDSP